MGLEKVIKGLASLEKKKAYTMSDLHNPLSVKDALFFISKAWVTLKDSSQELLERTE